MKKIANNSARRTADNFQRCSTSKGNGEIQKKKGKEVQRMKVRKKSTKLRNVHSGRQDSYCFTFPRKYFLLNVK